MKHRYVNGKARGTRVGMISASLMVTLITIMAQTALAANRVVSGTGSTSISGGGCNGNVPNGPPSTLGVNNGDNVVIYYNYSYTDIRDTGSGTAAHDFVQAVGYGGWTVADGRRINTTGGNAYGYGSIQRTVYNVQQGYYIHVVWFANITSDSCNSWGWKGGDIQLIPA